MKASKTSLPITILKIWVFWTHEKRWKTCKAYRIFQFLDRKRAKEHIE